MIGMRPDPRRRQLDMMLARDMIRLRDPATGRFLHLSGDSTVPTTNYAWLGYRYQAETLERIAHANGHAWPFVAVHRDLADGTKPSAEIDPEAFL